MTFAEAKVDVTVQLLGDNSNPVITASAVNVAIQDVSRYCQPESLIALWDDTVTDKFRMIPAIAYDEENDDAPIKRYLKTSIFAGVDGDNISLDPQLDLAIIYFISAYYSKKNKLQFRQLGIDICYTYDSSTIADPE